MYDSIAFAAQNAFLMVITDFYLTLTDRPSPITIGELTASFGDCTITKLDTASYQALITFGPTQYEAAGATVKDAYEKVKALKQADVEGPYKVFLWETGTVMTAFSLARSLREALALLAAEGGMDIGYLRNHPPKELPMDTPFGKSFYRK